MQAVHATNPLHHSSEDTACDEAIAKALAANEAADQQAAAAQAAANSRAAKLDQELALQAHDDEVTMLCRELSGALFAGSYWARAWELGFAASHLHAALAASTDREALGREALAR
jgi:hypothetical protein